MFVATGKGVLVIVDVTVIESLFELDWQETNINARKKSTKDFIFVI